MNRFLSRSIVTCIALSLVSCKSYHFDAGRIDERPYGPGTEAIKRGRDAPAAIELSDPQLYARETLINDRRREHSYLQRQLDNSETVPFTPQLQRELTQITSVAANLGISFNPLSALQFRDFRQNNALQQQMDRMALEFQLTKLQKDLEAFKSSYVGDPKAIPDRPSALTPPATPTAPSTTAIATQLQTSIQSLTALLNTSLPGARATDVKPDPREDFADRQALRVDLRAALAEAQLDDRHDVHGHGLYRLQFCATVAPRENLSKWGLAELTITRPSGDRAFFEHLYSAWLAHNTYRLNVGIGAASRDASSTLPDTAYVSLAAGSGLFDVARIWFSNANDKLETNALPDKNPVAGHLDPCLHARSERQANVLGCDSIYVAVPPGFRDRVSPPFPAFEDMAFRKLVSEMLQIELQKGWGRDPRKTYFELNDSCDAFTHQRFNVDPIRNRPTDIDTFVERIVRAGSYERTLPGYRTSTELQAVLLQKPKTDRRKEKTAKTKSTSSLKSSEERGSASRPSRPAAQSQLKLSGTAQALTTQLRLLQDAIVNPELDFAQRREAVKELNIEEERLLKTAIDIQREWPLERHMLLMSPQEALVFAEEMLTLAPVISSSMRGIGSRRDLTPQTHQKILMFESVFEEITQSARLYLRLLQDLNPACKLSPAKNADVPREANRASSREKRQVGAYSQSRIASAPAKADAKPNMPADKQHVLQARTYEQEGRTPPPKFCSLLLYRAASVEDPCAGGLLDGAGYAHATSPSQLSQRISSMSNVADAVQIAVNLQAAIPQSGVGAEAAAGYARQTAMKAQALQRRPIVVGFSGLADPDAVKPETLSQNAPSGVSNDKQSDGATLTTRFGWVFGPPAQVSRDGRNLVLEQALTNYQVNADVSVPGWWHELDLEARTLWIGNWQNAKLVSYEESIVGVRPIKVPLPLKRTDLDGLTDLLTYKTLGRGLQLTRISSVQPPVISACSPETTVVIYGANIWRNSKVFVAGVEVAEDNILLLPDMEGLAAKIKTDSLQFRSNQMDKPMVVVWTRDGYDQFPIAVTGGLSDGKCVDKAGGPPPGQSTTSAFAKIFPEKLSACDKSVEFTVTGKNLATARQNYYFGTLRAANVGKIVTHSAAAGKPTLSTIKVRFDSLQKANVGLDSVALAMVKPDGILSTGIGVAAGECAGPKAEAKQKTKPKDKKTQPKTEAAGTK